ncbi:MAG: glycosyltransferase N-terminal domain-containing protein [Gilvibacter sp.]
MKKIYNLLTKASTPVLKILGMVNPKIKSFVDGRAHVFEDLTQAISSSEKYIWVHCASLGEYEQGLPIIQQICSDYPGYKILLTFFSPSGYKVRHNSPYAHVVSYLPLDTPNNAKRFIELTNPVMAIFVKYEFWPNYFDQLKQRSIPTLLVSGVFRQDQAMFKSYGGWLKKSLSAVTHFFVQNETSKDLLTQLGYENVTLSGDTRFDRVSHQIEVDNRLEFMDHFAGEHFCIVIGSSWPEDEAVFLEYLNDTDHSRIRFVIAPHEIEEAKIEKLIAKLKVPFIRYTQLEKNEIPKENVLILDTIGLLTKVYSYAHIAYVGGAMGTSGLHNILEPATFGIPIIIGKDYQKFPEAKKLRELAGLYSVSSSAEFITATDRLINDDNLREKTGMICGHFINSNTGATRIVMNYIAQLHADGLV